jgi:hypothetical protein
VPIIICDGWTDAQVKAFRIMVNRSVTWAEWDDELLSLELQELAARTASSACQHGPSLDVRWQE